MRALRPGQLFRRTRRVNVAIPQRWARKFSAVRFAGQNRLRLPGNPRVIPRRSPQRNRSFVQAADANLHDPAPEKSILQSPIPAQTSGCRAMI